MNAIQSLMANAIGPVVRAVLTDWGCTVTVVRAVASSETDQQTTYTYPADDATLTDIAATVMDVEAAAKQRIYGVIQGASMVMVLPRQRDGMIAINTDDRIRVTSGPFEGRTFVAIAPGNPSAGALTTVSVSEV